jgi:transposase, IS30 family
MKHLTDEQRYIIWEQIGTTTQKEIALQLGVSPSTVCRELKRNSRKDGVYVASYANKQVLDKKRCAKRRKRYVQSDFDLIDADLNNKLSPEQIVGNLKREGKKTMSIESIYRYIWLDKAKGGKLYKNLRNQGKRYRKRGSSKDSRGLIEGRRCIDTRPEIVEDRSRFGDFEADTIVGKDHKGCIVSLNDRKTGLILIKHLLTRDAVSVKNAIVELLTPFKSSIKTITSDNGKEFTLHQEIASELGLDFYFAKPYSPWQRGSNENNNRLIRGYFPKGSSFEDITEESIKFAQDQLNNRPRKRYGFISPLEYCKKNHKIEIAFLS